MSKGSISLKTIPSDVKRTILFEQGELKAKCNCQMSQENTIYSIIRKWKKAKKIAINGKLIESLIEEL